MTIQFFAHGSSAKTGNSPKQDLPPSKEILVEAQSGRAVIQDFVPLAESLEWELGQQYLEERGNKAFLSDASPVPFVVNNDGTLSRNAAEVFFTSLVEAEKTGTLEPDIYVLELGIGVGLFARFFLDNFKTLCRKHKKDYYHRLCYVAADKSERMLLDACRHGVFANHPGRYQVRVVDAMEPEKVFGREALSAERAAPDGQRSALGAPRSALRAPHPFGPCLGRDARQKSTRKRAISPAT